MKKLLLAGLFCTMLFGNFSVKSYAIFTGIDNAGGMKYNDSQAETKIKANANAKDVKKAIADYKEGNYLSCISTLQEYLEGNKDNAIAWYYLAIAYMNIAMVKEASNAFDKVIELNATPKLTSYSIQAKLCMEKSDECKYENFTESEVSKLRENPAKFISQYYDSIMKKGIKSNDVIQIENLIKGNYENNIHPEAGKEIEKRRTEIKTSLINSGKI